MATARNHRLAETLARMQLKERIMAEGSSGGNSGIAFIVGGLVVVVAVLAAIVFMGGIPGGGSKKVDVNISAPAMPSAPEPK